MITAVDTNVVLDLLIPDLAYVEQSDCALAEAIRLGGLIFSEPVYAEVAARFTSGEEVGRFLDQSRIRIVPSGAVALAT